MFSISISGINYNPIFWVLLWAIFLIRLFEAWKPTPNLGHAFLWHPCIQTWKQETWIFFSLFANHSCWQVHLSSCWWLVLSTTSLGFNIDWRPAAFQEFCRTSAPDWDCRDIQPRGLKNNKILSCSVIRQPLLDYLDHISYKSG